MNTFRRSIAVASWSMVVALTAASAASAQGYPARRSAGWLELGGALRGQSDLMASPMLYRGTGPQLAMGYDRVRPGRRLEMTASFVTARLATGFTDGVPHHEQVYLADLGLRALYRLGSAWNGRVHFFAGGQLDLRTPLRVHDYDGNVKEYYADVFLPVQAAVGWEATLGRTVITERLAVPLFAVVGRCPYTGLKYAPDFSFAPPGRLVGFDHGLSLERPLSDRLDLRLQWQTTLIRYPEPRELAMVTHRLGLALALHRRAGP